MSICLYTCIKVFIIKFVFSKKLYFSSIIVLIIIIAGLKLFQTILQNIPVQDLFTQIYFIEKNDYKIHINWFL